MTKLIAAVLQLFLLVKAKIYFSKGGIEEIYQIVIIFLVFFLNCPNNHISGGGDWLLCGCVALGVETLQYHDACAYSYSTMHWEGN